MKNCILDTSKQMVEFFRYCFLALFFIIGIPWLLGGCATEIGDHSRLIKRQSANFIPADLEKNTSEQDAVLYQLQRRAGLTFQPESSDDWDQIIAAGLEYADAKCETYMGALVRLNRDKKTAVSEIGLIGTATAGVMAAAKSAAKDISLAAIAFGLAGSTVENLGGNVLFEIEPSSIRALVKALQIKFKDDLPRGYSTRPGAMSVIHSYATLCTPVTIEAEINHAVKNAQPKGIEGSSSGGRAPEVSNARITVDAKFSPDNNSDLLSQFLRVNGVIADGPRQKVEAFMRASGISEEVSVIGFLNDPAYVEQRIKAVEFFHLKK